MAMLDVAMILMSSHLTGYLRNGVHPKPHGNRHPHATNGAYRHQGRPGDARRQQHAPAAPLLDACSERPEMIKRTNDERDADHGREITRARRRSC